MELHWKDAQEIAIELCDLYPDLDPVTLRLSELLEMIEKLPDFKDDRSTSNEARLEAVLQAWIDERD